MNTVITVTTENLDSLTYNYPQQLAHLQALAAPGGCDFRSLDVAESYLRGAFPLWFVYRGGNHVALHVAPGVGGGPRVLLIAERPVEPVFYDEGAVDVTPVDHERNAENEPATAVVEQVAAQLGVTREPLDPVHPHGTGWFASLKAAVSVSRDEARTAAKRHGRTHHCPFVRSRGTLLCTAGPNGQEWPNIAAECPTWDGTKREVEQLVAKVLAEAPGITEIYIEGAFDMSDLFSFDDYEPRVSEWAVTVWTRAGGYQF